LCRDQAEEVSRSLRMSLILAALTLFAVLLMLAQAPRQATLALWLGGLALALYLLPGSTKIAAPVGAILSLGLHESIASLRPR
jgi:hypothetical protein